MLFSHGGVKPFAMQIWVPLKWLRGAAGFAQPTLKHERSVNGIRKS